MVPAPSSSPAPRWRLIAVVASTFRLPPDLTLWLYHAAVALHETGSPAAPLAGDLGEGRLVHLRRELMLGSLAGPGFEATLDGPAGKGLVRFIVTREGLAAHGREGAAALSAAGLN